MNIGIIYKYKSPSNKYYIGQTIDPSRRKRTHIYCAKKGSPLPFHRAIQKYGIENFEYSEIISISSKNPKHLKIVLNALEKFYISKYKKSFELYNITDGGDGIIGDKVTEKIKEYWNSKTPEELKNWGNMISDAKSKPILQFNIDGTFVKEYSNIYRSEIINPKEIMRCVKGELFTSSGYIWKYKEDCLTKLDELGNLRKEYIHLGQKGPKKKPILQYNKNGNFIQEWPSASDVPFVKRKSIVECLSGRNKTAGGYIWKYE